MDITAKGFENSHTKFGVLLSMQGLVMTPWVADILSNFDVGACIFEMCLLKHSTNH